MKEFEITAQLIHRHHWALTRPIMILYTQLDLLSLPELQFKLLYENDIEIPKPIQLEIFGDRLSELSKKGSKT